MNELRLQVAGPLANRGPGRPDQSTQPRPPAAGQDDLGTQRPASTYEWLSLC